MTSELNIAREISSSIHQNYPSSEYYLSNAKAPCIPEEDFLKTIPEKLKNDPQRIEIFKHYMAFLIRDALLDFLKTWLIEHNKQFEMISLSTSVAQITGHGECEVLCNLLILKLMQKGISSIITKHIITIEDRNHMYISMKHENQVWVLDTFFDICCPESEYFDNPKLIAYFQSFNKFITIDKNLLKSNSKGISYYSKNDYLKYLPILEKMIQEMIEIKNPIIEQIKTDIDYVKRVHHDPKTYDQNKAFAYLKKYFEAKKSFDLTAEETEKASMPFIKACLTETPDENQKAFLLALKNRPHALLPNLAKFILGPDEELKPILNSIEGKDKLWAQALRRACSNLNPLLDDKIFTFIKVFIASGLLTNIINTPAGDNGYAAIHWAALAGNIKLYQLLCDAGANPDLKPTNKNQETAKEILERVLKKKSTLPSIKSIGKNSFHQPAPKIVNSVVSVEKPSNMASPSQ